MINIAPTIRAVFPPSIAPLPMASNKDFSGAISLTSMSHSSLLFPGHTIDDKIKPCDLCKVTLDPE